MRWWLSAAIAACAGSRPPPPTCPTSAPTCAAAPDDATALALVDRDCMPCHAPGGLAGLRLDSLAALRAAPIGRALATCEMPPTAFDPAERARLVAWSSCGNLGGARPLSEP